MKSVERVRFGVGTIDYILVRTPGVGVLHLLFDFCSHKITAYVQAISVSC